MPKQVPPLTSLRLRMLSQHKSWNSAPALAGAWMRNAGFAPHLVEAQLSHVEANQIVAAYQDKPHLLYLAERHQMMQARADSLRFMSWSPS